MATMLASVDVLPTEPLSPSVIRILEGAVRALANRGARRLSMSDVIEASGVSRGTLYKYFSNKDEVLAAVSEFVSVNFEIGVREAADAHTDPIDRFRAVMRFYSRYTLEQTSDRLLEFEPAFHLDFFRTHFVRHKAAVNEALSHTFDHLERVAAVPISRSVVVEALVRMGLSTLIVPADVRWVRQWDNAAEDIENWIFTLADIVPHKMEA
jgi:AcrR family transcriptional regulator